MAKSYDLVIRGGRVVDGTGEPARSADVAIRGDTIIDVGSLSPAEETPVLEAAGLIVAPGFIDAWGAMDPWAPTYAGAESKLLQGICTDVAGGLGQYPFPAVDSPVESDDPDPAPAWADARSYMLDVARAGSGIHRAFLAGYGQIRSSVVGPTDAPATRDEVRQIAKVIGASLEAGCIGLAIDLSEPTAAFANTDEIVEVARLAAREDAVVAVTIRDTGPGLRPAMEEIFDIISRTGVDMVLPGFRIGPSASWSMIDWVERKLEEVNESGKNLSLVVEPYVAWTGPLAKLLPPSAREGGVSEIADRLQAGTYRSELLQLLEARSASEDDYWTRVCPMGLDEDEKAVADVVKKTSKSTPAGSRITIASMAAATKRLPGEVYLDLVAQRPNRRTLFFEMSEGNRKRELGWDFVMVGSGEAARPVEDSRAPGPVHPRARGAFARLVRRYVREKKMLSLEQAIRRITSLPADRFGLESRGRVASGCAADLVLFRADTIADLSTYSDPVHLPVGIDHVMVAGRFAVRDGRITGAKQGSVLRRS